MARTDSGQTQDLSQSTVSPARTKEAWWIAAGDGIAPHTDRQLPNVRVVLNVNRRWQMNDGGIWALSSDAALRQNTSYLPALSNTGLSSRRVTTRSTRLPGMTDKACIASSSRFHASEATCRRDCTSGSRLVLSAHS